MKSPDSFLVSVSSLTNQIYVLLRPMEYCLLIESNALRSISPTAAYSGLERYHQELRVRVRATAEFDPGWTFNLATRRPLSQIWRTQSRQCDNVETRGP